MTQSKRRWGAVARTIAALALLAAPASAHAQAISKPQLIIDDALQTVRKLKSDPKIPGFQKLLNRAKAVLIFPEVLRAGFVIGGQGGSGVLLVRHGDQLGAESWSYPSFHTMGAGSIGLQLGVEAQEIILIIQDYDALLAIINNHFKIGGDISVAAGSFGTGQGGAITSNFDADVISFSTAQGAFVGASIQGAVITPSNDNNYDYYGPGARSRTITIKRQFANAGADNLRQALSEPVSWIPADKLVERTPGAIAAPVNAAGSAPPAGLQRPAVPTAAAPAQSQTWGAPAAPAPGSTQAWGAPAAPAPASTQTWGAPAAPAPAPASRQAWGTPTGQAPAGSSSAWGAPPPGPSGAGRAPVTPVTTQ
ncbi:MAG: YSC84-related protein [Alphaproteobacteria bacterium]|nr:YSC84-related protein [Alphaproteobacteria bacterium]